MTTNAKPAKAPAAAKKAAPKARRVSAPAKPDTREVEVKSFGDVTENTNVPLPPPAKPTLRPLADLSVDMQRDYAGAAGYRKADGFIIIES